MNFVRRWWAWFELHWGQAMGLRSPSQELLGDLGKPFASGMGDASTADLGEPVGEPLDSTIPPPPDMTVEHWRICQHCKAQTNARVRCCCVKGCVEDTVRK